MTPVDLADLWLPILVAWIATYVLSTLAWTVLPHHRPEWDFVRIDGSLRTAIDSAPGDQCLLVEGDADAANNPTACRGMLILWRHRASMGANIAMTATFFLVAALTIGYMASIALSRETSTLDVFRFTATAGVLAHVMAGVPTIIWFRRKWLMDLLDGVAYALATGAAFALLWPR